MLNANYISLFGMQRNDILIRQKFLNDLRDLEEINDCFKKQESSGVAQKDPFHSLLHPRKLNNKQQPPLLATTNAASNRDSNKFPKLNSNQQFAERLKNLELKKSPKKEFAKHNLEKKTNTNVYFWYFKDNETADATNNIQSKNRKLFGFKLPAINNNNDTNNNKRTKKRKDSLSSDLTNSTQSFKLDDNLLNVIEEHIQPTEEEIKKPIDFRPKSPTESICSVDADADMRTVNKKKRVILKTAQLKQLNISSQFIEDAKKMVFIPACKSFHPIEVSKYVSDNKNVNNEYGYDRFQ